ncbi:MAG: HEPN domain-containing protein [Caldiserica bacterium]|nr:HEPN domain-containing protein [Caldisericota bacterium]
MEYKEEVSYWLKAAAHDLEVAEILFERRKYDWCLFIAHLVLEKTLKALYVRDNAKMPPPIHKLDILARETKLSFSLEDLEFLKKVNEFNIQARYPDKKFSFYKICTKEFAEKFFNRIKEFYKWLLKEIK